MCSWDSNYGREAGGSDKGGHMEVVARKNDCEG
jgi:hypothetical protein